MKTTTSKDGTVIAYEQMGSGPPLILVDGALCGRTFGPMAQLAALLATRFTVIHYDRRGRGDSGADTRKTFSFTEDTVPREIEDIQALAEVLGGSAHLFGISSGAMLAMRAASGGVNARSLAMYEAPLSLDGTRIPNPRDFREQITEQLTAGDNGAAVKIFMRAVGVPAFGIVFMQLMRGVWNNLKKGAPTLPNDFAALGDTQTGGPLPAEIAEKVRSLRIPLRTMYGGKSPAYMGHAAKRVAAEAKDGSTSVVARQTHNVAAKALAPELITFFSAQESKISAAA